eukprot:COSAG05_NODE_200_length_14421_cov_5.767840_4_plen_45_part_00
MHAGMAYKSRHSAVTTNRIRTPVVVSGVVRGVGPTPEQKLCRRK